jgi:L-rhamnose mutarotase
MQRFGYVMTIKPELVDEYRKMHDNIWPEMSAALARHGWRNYSIFYNGDATLFGYMECEESWDASLAGIGTEDIAAKWMGEMGRFFVLPEGADPDQDPLAMIEWQEVFHAD